MQKEGDGRKMATAYGGRRDEEECCVDGESCPKLDEANNLEGRIVCLPEIPTQEEQSPDVILARATEACGFVRLKETPSNILAGCHDLFENWEPGRLGNRGGDRGLCEDYLDTPQNSIGGKSNVGDLTLLERGDEEPGLWLHSARKNQHRGDERNGEVVENERHEETLNKEDLVQRLYRLFGPDRSDSRDNEACKPGVSARICGQYQPCHKYISPHWHGYLPCPEYLGNPKCSKVRARNRPQGWELHAPEVTPTILDFGKLAVWLTIGSFSRVLARQINDQIPLGTQIQEATCRIDEWAMKELLTKGLISKWGSVKEPRETMFAGNAFLHAEEGKRRWRVIFHPYHFNKHVRLLKLHTTRLPRIRKVLKQITSYNCTVKLDLKCAFFQIPIEPGLFVFRKGAELYTLNRLPMGSSVSVMIAQHLSEQVAGRILHHLVADKATSKGEFNVFVDDIFVSFDPICGDVNETIRSAVQKTARDLQVTFKFCQVYVGGTCLGAEPASVSTTVGPPGHQGAIERLMDGQFLTRVETLDVLGVVFRPETREIRLKDEFKSKLSNFLKGLDLINMTARDLWRCVGLCFYTIYAIGVCPSRFFGVFRCLSRVAGLLQGADRHNPLWEELVPLHPNESSALDEMVNYVLSFPTNVFVSGLRPNRFVFSDAANGALGVVIYAQGRVEVHSRIWSPLERPLAINVKEVIAACQGILWLRPQKNETVFLGVDNTVAFFEIIAGQSSNPIANECVGVIRRGTSLALIWVPTQLMPADAPSRQIDDPRISWKVITLIGHTTRYVFLPILI